MEFNTQIKFNHEGEEILGYVKDSILIPKHFEINTSRGLKTKIVVVTAYLVKPSGFSVSAKPIIVSPEDILEIIPESSRYDD